MLVQLLLGPGILVDLALMELVKPTPLARKRLGMVDQPLGPRWSDALAEIHAANLQDVIDKCLELRRVAERQMPFEDHPVKTRKIPGDQTGKLYDERAY